MSELTWLRLKEVLDYNPETGVFVNKIKRCSQAMPGGDPGYVSWNGYRIISVDKRKYRAHRLAWFYMTGAWPVSGLDHINRERLDNRFANLREADKVHNAVNSITCRSLSGFRGVTKNHKGWQARIKVRGQQFRLGTYQNPEHAHAVYTMKRRELFGDFVQGI